jgi:hypothetical protein
MSQTSGNSTSNSVISQWIAEVKHPYMRLVFGRATIQMANYMLLAFPTSGGNLKRKRKNVMIIF